MQSTPFIGLVIVTLARLCTSTPVPASSSGTFQDVIGTVQVGKLSVVLATFFDETGLIYQADITMQAGQTITPLDGSPLLRTCYQW